MNEYPQNRIESAIAVLADDDSGNILIKTKDGQEVLGVLSPGFPLEHLPDVLGFGWCCYEDGWCNAWWKLRDKVCKTINAYADSPYQDEQS